MHCLDLNPRTSTASLHHGCPRACNLQVRCVRVYRGRAGSRAVRAQAASSDDGKLESTSLAPAKPKTPYGQMLEYMLKAQPELFRTAVEDQLRRLKEEKDAKAEGSYNESEETDKSQLILYQRMEEVRAAEVRATLEDLMYVSILEKFVGLGVEMLPRMSGFVDVSPTSLKALTEGIHSREALELVREHLMGVMGPAAQAQFSNAALKMSKFQMAQVYAASIMFGYFLRRVDTRFQLEKTMGSLTPSKEDAVARLQRLFAQADTYAPWEEPLPDSPSSSSSSRATSPAAEVQDLDSVPPPPPKSEKKPEDEQTGTRASDWVVAGGSAARETPAKKQKSALRRYVEGFDQQTMVETARIVSLEGAALVERQTSALVGDIKKLTAQVQEAVGTDVTSMQDVMDRMAQAVRSDTIETLTMTVGTQRRAVLEAVAFGTFLRDVETSVDSEWGLLTIREQLMLPGSDDSDE